MRAVLNVVVGVLLVVSAFGVGSAAELDASVTTMQFETISGVQVVSGYYDLSHDESVVSYELNIKIEQWRNGQLLATLLNSTKSGEQQENCPDKGACSGSCLVWLDNGSKWGNCNVILSHCNCKISGKVSIGIVPQIGDVFKIGLTVQGGPTDPLSSNNTMQITFN
ncbi:MAG: hypothetical protein U0V87_04370 [Acidobacteriota bacterium]